jgi:hypothetical protein
MKSFLLLTAALCSISTVHAHYVPDNEYAATSTNQLPFVVEK